MNNFGKVDLLQEAWGLLKTNVSLFAKIFGVYLLYYIVQYAVQAYFKYSLAVGLVSFIFGVIGVVLELGLIYLVLKLIDGKKPTIADIYTYPNLIKKVVIFILAGIVFGVAVVVGLILLVIPGIYIAIRGMFFSYYIVDKNAGIIDSIKMSWKLTEGAVLNLFLFDLLLVVFNVIGVLLLGIGLFVTIPVSLLAVALLYRRFQK